MSGTVMPLDEIGPPVRTDVEAKPRGAHHPGRGDLGCGRDARHWHQACSTLRKRPGPGSKPPGSRIWRRALVARSEASAIPIMAARLPQTGCRDSARPEPAEIQRGAVVDGGADDRRAEGRIDAATEAGVLEHQQALVVETSTAPRRPAAGVGARTGYRRAAGRRGSMPSARSCSSTGMMVSISSVPMWPPPSPAWGLEPGDAGCAAPAGRVAHQISVEGCAGCR